jgi:predicted permease
MERIFQDLRYAARQLRKAPGFSFTAILILGLGIGGASAIFSALNPILFEPLPYPQANRIMRIWYVGADGGRIPQSFHTYREISERNRSFEKLAVLKPWQPTLSSADQPERLDGQRVSAGFFQVLGISPVLGRDFQSSDDVLNGPKVVILSHGLWRRRFGSDSAILGRQIRLDDEPYTVIGVMPSGFENVLSPSAEAWAPLQYDTGNVSSIDAREWGHHLSMVGRLRSGTGLAQARSDLAWIASTPVPEFPRPGYVSLDHGLLTESLQDDVTRGVRPALLAVFGAVILVLLIACVNVTNLVLARGAQRQGEISVRAALGAAPPRLITQLITESLLLAFLGGIAGLAITEAGIRALVALSPAGLPRVSAIRLDGNVFAFAFEVSALVGLAIGVIPAWQASRRDLQYSLQNASQRTVSKHQVARRAFVVAEVALALVLLVSAGLLLHSLRRLLAVPPGFDATGVISMQVQTNGRRFDDQRVNRQFFEEALESVRQVPGVTSAAFTSQLPLSGDNDVYGAQFEGDGPETGFPVYRYAVTADYFETLRIPLLRGRYLSERDTENTPPVILVSESLAKRRFPKEDPIGKRVKVGDRSAQPYTIVGVVGDVKQMSLGLDDSDAIYITPTQWHFADGTLSLVVRTQGDPVALVSAIKNAVWRVDKDQPVVRVASMSDLLAASAAERRFVLVLFEAFGMIALVLAGTGLYGVLSGSVEERTREIGVRAALGAGRTNIVVMVLRQGMALVGLGLAIGFVGAVTATQAIGSMLFGISRLDAATYVEVMMLLAVMSAIACAVPAWRAVKIDPMVALRYE